MFLATEGTEELPVTLKVAAALEDGVMVLTIREVSDGFTVWVNPAVVLQVMSTMKLGVGDGVSAAGSDQVSTKAAPSPSLGTYPVSIGADGCASTGGILSSASLGMSWLREITLVSEASSRELTLCL